MFGRFREKFCFSVSFLKLVVANGLQETQLLSIQYKRGKKVNGTTQIVSPDHETHIAELNEAVAFEATLFRSEKAALLGKKKSIVHLKKKKMTLTLIGEACFFFETFVFSFNNRILS